MARFSGMKLKAVESNATPYNSSSNHTHSVNVGVVTPMVEVIPSAEGEGIRF